MNLVKHQVNLVKHQVNLVKHQNNLVKHQVKLVKQCVGQVNENNLTFVEQMLNNAIIPFKSLLLGLFFMTVGMSIDFKLLISHIEQILLYSVIIVLIKGVIIFLLCKLFKFGSTCTRLLN